LASNGESLQGFHKTIILFRIRAGGRTTFLGIFDFLGELHNKSTLKAIAILFLYSFLNYVL
jgi:hypothetical protein